MSQIIFYQSISRRRWVLRILAVVLAVFFTASSTVLAARRHSVTTYTNPDNGEVYAGTRLRNDADGYVIGWLSTGQTFDNHDTRSDFHYGRAFGSINMCSWAEPGSLSDNWSDVPDSCSEGTKQCMENRDVFGKDFNCAPGQCSDGTLRDIAGNCPFYHNYFYGSCPDGFRSGSFKDPVGVVPGTQVKYRYTTLDGQAAMVRVPDNATYNWGFIPTSCLNVGQPGDTKWVDFGYNGPENGSESQPYNTLGEGVDAVTPGGQVIMKAGSTGERPTLSKPMYLKSSGGTATIGR